MTQFAIQAMVAVIAFCWVVGIFGYLVSKLGVASDNKPNIVPMGIFLGTLAAFTLLGLTLFTWGDKIQPPDPSAPRYMPVHEQLYKLERVSDTVTKK